MAGSTKIGQGPLAPAEYQAIKQIIIGLIADHGPSAVKWIWEQLAADPQIGPTVRDAAQAAAKKQGGGGGGGAALLVLGALALGGKKHGRRR